MSDFDRVVDLAYDEESPRPTTSVGNPAVDVPAVAPIHWSPEGPAPLLTSGQAPGLFTTAGVDDAPSPLMTPSEEKQRSDEAALLAKGGQFTGDRSPSWSESHTARDGAPGPGFSDRLDHFRQDVVDKRETYEDQFGYSPGPAGMVATIDVLGRDFGESMKSHALGAVEHVKGAWHAHSGMSKLEEGAKAAGDVGNVILGATTVADPVNALIDGGGGAIGNAPAFAPATADGVSAGALEAVVPARSSAEAVAGSAAENVLLSEGGDGDRFRGRRRGDDDGEELESRGEKGKSFRGGKKKDRDNWHGFSDSNFQRWWHRVGKQESGGADIDSREDAQAAYESWVQQGKPTGGK